MGRVDERQDKRVRVVLKPHIKVVQLLLRAQDTIKMFFARLIFWDYDLCLNGTSAHGLAFLFILIHDRWCEVQFGLLVECILKLFTGDRLSPIYIAKFDF